MALPFSRRAVRADAVSRPRPAWLADVVAGGAILAVALVLSWPLLMARDLRTGSGDWPAHAYRVRAVLDDGLASWSHTWAGGMPLWEGYQAVPHLVTAAVVRATGLPIERAMVLLAGLLLVVLRVGVYAAARWLGAPPSAALAGALLTALLDTVRQPLANYSELWGLALTPYVLAGAYRWAGRPGGFLLAAAIGLSAEVHPLLAVSGGLAFVSGFVASPGGRSVAALAGQALVAAAAASVFWLPVVTSARPSYTEPYFMSPEFARLLLHWGTAGFLPGWPLAVAATGVAGLAAVRRRGVAAPTRFLLVFGAGVTTLILLSLAPWTPAAFREGQLARLVGLAPLLVGLLGAVLIGEVGRGGGRHTVPVVAFTLASAALVRGGAGQPPATRMAAAPIDPVSRAWTEHGLVPRGRIYADPVTTAEASRWAGTELRFAGSYSGREWSIVHGPLTFFLAGHGTAENRSAYLTALGVEYVLVPAGARPALAHPLGGGVADWEVVRPGDTADLLRLPWPAPLAWLLQAGERGGLTVPDADFRDVASAYVRDASAGRLAARSLAADTPRPEVTYPDGETIVVRAEGLDGRHYLVVNENWDTAWRAEAAGRRLRLERFGLNQIGVDLTGVAGDATIRLTHRHRREAVLGLALSLLTLPLGAILALAARTRERTERWAA